MNELVAATYRDKLSHLKSVSIITHLEGLVRTEETALFSSNNRRLDRIPIPLGCQNVKDCGSQYVDLIPEGVQYGKRCMVFFEDWGCTASDTKGTLTSKLRLLCWYNPQLFAKFSEEQITGNLTSLIVSALNERGDCQDKRFAFFSEPQYAFLPIERSLFSRYTFSAKALSCPYGYFGIEITTRIRMNYECFLPLFTSSSSCSN